MLEMKQVSIDASSGSSVRLAARNGSLTRETTGLAPGYVQANIAIVPSDYANQFSEFCRANSKSCPVLAMSNPGEPSLPLLGEDIDIRTDLPRYRIYRDGDWLSEPTSLIEYWRNDLVTFAIGCSFTFEHAILDAGIPLRHVAMGRNVAMYRTSIETQMIGPFGGPLVVSMRPFLSQNVESVIEISGRFAAMHGAPVQVGDPSALGIIDLAQPDYGEAVPLYDGDVPVFWACGVTSQVALQSARVPFFFSHAPGCMLVTDILNRAFEDPAN